MFLKNSFGCISAVLTVLVWNRGDHFSVWSCTNTRSHFTHLDKRVKPYKYGEALKACYVNMFLGKCTSQTI